MARVFVAIPSLDDNELVPTMLDALEKSSGLHHVVLGVSIASSTKKLYRKASKVQKQYPQNIVLDYHKITKSNAASLMGVGKGRLRANGLYGGEEYYLQIDSHTMFSKDWDSQLVDLFEQAKVETGNDLVLLTAYAGKYYLDENKQRTLRGFDSVPGSSKPNGFMYPTFSDADFSSGYVPMWGVHESEIARGSEKLFLPSFKFNANFSFGGKDFALNTGITEKEVFFEEEILQSIELMGRGYSLVYPNVEEAIIKHYYADFGNDEEVFKKYKRKTMKIAFRNSGSLYHKSLSDRNYMNYMTNPENSKKIESYQRYAGIDLLSGVAKRKFPFPKSWRLDMFEDQL